MSGWPCNPLFGLTLRNVTLQELCLPTRSFVNPEFMYLSMKKMLRFAILAAASAASFGAFAFATPKPAHPLRLPGEETRAILY